MPSFRSDEILNRGPVGLLCNSITLKKDREVASDDLANSTEINYFATLSLLFVGNGCCNSCKSKITAFCFGSKAIWMIRGDKSCHMNARFVSFGMYKACHGDGKDIGLEAGQVDKVLQTSFPLHS